MRERERVRLRENQRAKVAINLKDALAHAVPILFSRCTHRPERCFGRPSAHAGATILIAQHVGDDLRGVPLVPSTYCFPSGLWLCSASQAAQGLLARSDLLLEDCL